MNKKSRILQLFTAQDTTIFIKNTIFYSLKSTIYGLQILRRMHRCLLTVDCCLLNYQKNLQVCFDLPVILRV